MHAKVHLTHIKYEIKLKDGIGWQKISFGLAGRSIHLRDTRAYKVGAQAFNVFFSTSSLMGSPQQKSGTFSKMKR